MMIHLNARGDADMGNGSEVEEVNFKTWNLQDNIDDIQLGIEE